MGARGEVVGKECTGGEVPSVKQSTCAHEATHLAMLSEEVKSQCGVSGKFVNF